MSLYFITVFRFIDFFFFSFLLMNLATTCAICDILFVVVPYVLGKVILAGKGKLSFPCTVLEFARICLVVFHLMKASHVRIAIRFSRKHKGTAGKATLMAFAFAFTVFI
jgi:hypothetical protein